MCTRVLCNNNEKFVISGRTMDWPESTDPRLVLSPRNTKRHGGMLGSKEVVAKNPLNWRSIYGSVAISLYGLGSIDGINECGLAAHGLYLRSTSLPKRDPSIPGLQIGLWIQYLLDNAKNVAEALELLDTFQLVMVEAHGRKATIHLALEDSSGDSAVVEYVDGEQKIHHGKRYTVMTNDPEYPEQLRLLKKHDFSQPSKDMHLPGNVNARDRFQRASYYLNLLPQSESMREAVAGVLAIMRNVSVPFGAPYGEFGIYNTEYRTVCDLTNRFYFFELATSPNVIWVDISKLDFSKSNSRLCIDPHNYSLNGDVSGEFTEASDILY